MYKSKIKLTQKYIDSLGLDIKLEDIKEENQYIKRVSVDPSGMSPPEFIEDKTGHYCIGTISTLDVDSDGDVVIPDGIDLTRFKKNPTVLFNHSLANPVAYSEELIVYPDLIRSKTKFGTTEEAQRVYQLVKDKVIRCHSIGFITKEYLVRGEKAFNDVLNVLVNTYPERFANKVNEVMRIITKALLVEYSIVVIPANEEAVINEVKNLKTTEEVKEVVETTEEVAEEIKEVKEEVPKNVDKVEEKEEKKIEETKVEENKPIEIKIVKRNNPIVKKSTVESRKKEQMKELYIALWGV